MPKLKDTDLFYLEPIEIVELEAIVEVLEVEVEVLEVDVEVIEPEA